MYTLHAYDYPQKGDTKNYHKLATGVKKQKVQVHKIILYYMYVAIYEQHTHHTTPVSVVDLHCRGV